MDPFGGKLEPMKHPRSLLVTETTALTTTSHPSNVWERHVDDVFSIIQKSNRHDFFQHIDSLYPRTKFTMGTEQNPQLYLCRLTGNLRTQTNTFKFTSHYLARVKKRHHVTIRQSKNIISNPSDQEKEENHLTAVLQANGYPKRFISNTIKASQLPRQTANNDNTENQDQTAPVRINLPYVKGKSEQLKRIFNDYNINCKLFTTTTLRTLLSHAKILYPQSKGTTLSINMTAKTARLSVLENQ